MHMRHLKTACNDPIHKTLDTPNPTFLQKLPAVAIHKNLGISTCWQYHNRIITCPASAHNVEEQFSMKNSRGTAC